jgi:outer membrane protein
MIVRRMCMGRYLKRLLIPVFGVAVAVMAVSPPAGADAPLRLDLDTCVEIALEVNVSALKADYELDIATNGVITSASTLLPQVSLHSTNSKYEELFGRQVGDKIIMTDQAYNASLSLGESVSLPGIMGVFQSLADRRATLHYVNQIDQEVTYVAKQTYLMVLRTRRLLAVAEEALELSERRLERAQAMVEVGSAVRSDVLRAQVELSNNQLDLISARNDVRLAESALKYYLGLDDSVELELEDALEVGGREYSLDGALKTASEWRPDIKMASAALSAAGHSVWAERGGWFPYVSFSWTDYYTSDRFPDEISELKDAAEWSWYLTLGIDIFDGFQTFGRVRQAKARRNSAREDLLQTQRDAAFEVKEAFYSVEEARQRVEVSEKTVEVAEEDLRLSEERYRLGAGTMLEQIDSQVALSEARTSHIEALYDLLLSQARLVRAMGKE